MRLRILLFWITATLLGCSADSRGTNNDPNAATAGVAGTATAGASQSGVSGTAQGTAGARGTLTSAAGMNGSARAQSAGAGAGATAIGAGAGGVAGSAGVAGAGAAAASGAAGRAAVGGNGGQSGGAGASGNGGAAGQGGRGGSAALAGNSGGSTTGLTPVYRIPLRVHIAQSKLTEAELGVILSELNQIWLSQAGVCFESEVTASETNRTDGFDFRYTAGQIPGASSANGVTQNAHSIWSIDHPRLGDVMMPVMNPTARTTAHELGHALGLAHENPPPSTDCASPCYCAQLGDGCDEYLMRSGTKGFHLSKPEIDIARGRAARVALPDQAPSQCGAPMFTQ
jgi:hypothetical protein